MGAVLSGVPLLATWGSVQWSPACAYQRGTGGGATRKPKNRPAADCAVW